MSTSADTRKSEPEQMGDGDVTLVDEVLSRACPGECGTTVEVTIPAGSSMFTARLMRTFAVKCEECAAREDAEARRREHLRIFERNAKNCELPKTLRALTFDSYETHRPGAKGALAAAEAWARGEHEKPGLMLCGPVGVGKTRLAATATWAALRDFKRAWTPRYEEESEPVPGIAVRWVNVADLIARLTAGFGDADRAEALRTLTGRTALVLDDLDKINPSLHVLAHLYAAIDKRVAHGAPLIVTTNLTPGELLAKLETTRGREDEEERAVMADSIVSRLTGYCTVHEITGEDGRQ